MVLAFCNVLIVSSLTPPKIRIFSANRPVADFRANFQHIYCPLS